jgi:preprotein translocase subunit SecE
MCERRFEEMMMDASPNQPTKKTTIAEFAREVRQEALKVSWPSRKETAITTAMVFAMSVAAAIFFFMADHVIAFAVRTILGLGA